MERKQIMSLIPRCEHPRPDRQRDAWINLNGEWDFEIDNGKVGIEKKFYERESLDGKITVPFSPESILSGIGYTDFMNAVWYRRNIEIPADWQGKRVILHMDACDHTTWVFVNGKSVGTPHCGGYTSFSYDITDSLKESGNYLTVYAEDDVRSGKQFAGKQSTKLNSYGDKDDGNVAYNSYNSMKQPERKPDRKQPNTIQPIMRTVIVAYVFSAGVK